MAERLGTGLQHPLRGFESLCHLEKPDVCRVFALIPIFPLFKSKPNIVYLAPLGRAPSFYAEARVGCSGASPLPNRLTPLGMRAFPCAPSRLLYSLYILLKSSDIADLFSFHYTTIHDFTLDYCLMLIS